MNFKKTKTLKLKLQDEYCKDGYVLDVGFAASPNLFLKDAVGIDITLPKKVPSNYAHVAACNLNNEPIPFPDESFDNVIAGDVIEHIENPSLFLREANRVLRFGGRLIISTPQANDWWTTIHNWFLRGIIGDPDPGEHLSNWTFLDMTRILKKNGFILEKLDGFYMHFPKINFKIRVRHFPALSWQVFYVARKTGSPDTATLVCVDGEWKNV